MVERGCVKWFNNRTGWGFIARAGGADVFVRHDRISGDGYKLLRPGDTVEFVVRQSRRGPYAINVIVLGRAEKAHPGHSATVDAETSVKAS
jgi:CspA family cold shock protein